MTTYHIAQVNVGRVKAPLEDARMAGFVTRLDEVNALADHSPGFVWRLQTSEGNATYLRPYDDDRILVNMSVWELCGSVYGAVVGAGGAHPRCGRGKEASGAPREAWSDAIRVYIQGDFSGGCRVSAGN